MKMSTTESNNIEAKVSKFFGEYPIRKYGNSNIIIHGQDVPEGVMYLISGLVTQYDVSPSGSKIIVNTFKPNAFFPMSWAINETENDYFYEAIGDVKLMFAPRLDVVDFIMKNPDVMLDLLSRVYKGTDGLLRKNFHLMGGSAEARLRYGLLIRAKRFGFQEKDGAVIIKVSELEFANELGLARETVSRELSKLKKANLIYSSKGRITIPDITSLESQL